MFCIKKFCYKFYWLFMVVLTVVSIWGGMSAARFSVQSALAKEPVLLAQETGFDQLNDARESFAGDSQRYAGGTALTDPRQIIARVVNYLLRFVAIILLGLILYSGYLLWSARGNTDQVTTAKTVMRNSLIGLIIVFMSMAIASFIFKAFTPTYMPEETHLIDTSGE